MSETAGNKTSSKSASPAAGGGALEEGRAPDLSRLLDVPLDVAVQLGRRRMRIAEVLALVPGSVVEFSKPADEPLDVLVNDQLIARGEAVVMGERYGVRITEVVSPNQRLQSSGVIKDDGP